MASPINVLTITVENDTVERLDVLQPLIKEIYKESFDKVARLKITRQALLRLVLDKGLAAIEADGVQAGVLEVPAEPVQAAQDTD